jgi:hypothetical protein
LRETNGERERERETFEEIVRVMKLIDRVTVGLTEILTEKFHNGLSETMIDELVTPLGELTKTEGLMDERTDSLTHLTWMNVN